MLLRSSVKAVPYGEGDDHAEGMALFSPPDSEVPSLLVVYDSASRQRFVGDNGVKADIFSL